MCEMSRSAALLLFIALIASTATAAIDGGQASSEYARLQKWSFSAPVALPAGGVTFTRDTATWTLTTGTVRLMEPAADGSISGVVFEGTGRFVMTIPDRFEVAQLRRFTKKADLTSIDQPITAMVLRTSDPALARLFPPTAGGYTPYGLATKRHESWLTDQFNDTDARILTAELNAGGVQTTVDVKTADFDWLTWDYDSSRGEEVLLTRYDRMPERWISLDRAEDRQADGRPSPKPYLGLASLEHIDMKADLTKRGSMGEVGGQNQYTMNGSFNVEESLTGVGESVSALRFDLSPWAQNVTAFTEDGTPLMVIRDRIGKRAALLENKISDDDFVVILDKPLLKGEKRKVRFAYEQEMANYALGHTWYPTISDTLHQKHTARMELTVTRRNELRSMGKMESRKEQDKSETSVWIVAQPVKMVTFSTATRFEEVKLEVDGIPKVVSFGPDYQLGNTAKVRNVGVDVVNSLQYFQNVLGEKVTGEQFYVTSIAGGHGQAFDGFLHMSEDTYTSEHPGASELFRAHEVAHEWWGHKVGWTSYRDQWLSEAFAEYMAMMFVRDTVKGGDKFFDEILRSYDGIMKGNFAGGFSKFNRPWLIERSTVERARLGPIGHGYRAATADIPAGYTIQTYIKGPMVLHMLRQLLLFKTGKDEAFIGTLRNFMKEYSGKNASTADFRRVLEQTTQGDWGWFFDAWIYGADVPSYTWNYDVKPADGAFLLTMNVERRDVPEWFSIPIPVRVEFEGGKQGYFYIPSKSDKQTVTQKLPAKPKNVVFAPDYSVLASIRRN
jgi:hypothetical protein